MTPRVDQGGNRITYWAIISRGSETRKIIGARREIIDGRVVKTTPPLSVAWEQGEPIKTSTKEYLAAIKKRE